MIYEVDTWDRLAEERYYYYVESIEEVISLLEQYDGVVDPEFLKELNNSKYGQLICTKYDCAVTKYI